MRRAMMTLAGMTCMSKKYEKEDLVWVRADLLVTPIDGEKYVYVVTCVQCSVHVMYVFYFRYW